MVTVTPSASSDVGADTNGKLIQNNSPSPTLYIASSFPPQIPHINVITGRQRSFTSFRVEYLKKYVLIHIVKTTPTKCTLIYVNYELLLSCFASESNFLILFLSITNNICLWKVLFRNDTLANYSKNLNKIRVIWRILLETVSSAKGEERTASADCKLGGFKHRIFK